MRLIRDDELIMAIANWQQTLKPGWSPVNDTDTVIYNTLEEVAGLIETQPTANDVEAVVRELESKIELSRGLSKDEDNAEGMFTISELFYRKGLKEAVDIVKRGGRNEDSGR